MEAAVMNLLKSIEFADPFFLWSLVIVPGMIAWYIWKGQRLYAHLSVSAARSFALPTKNIVPKMRHSGIVLRSLAVTMLIIGLARPQTSLSWQDTTTEGIDIVIASDI